MKNLSPEKTKLLIAFCRAKKVKRKRKTILTTIPDDEILNLKDYV